MLQRTGESTPKPIYKSDEEVVRIELSNILANYCSYRILVLLSDIGRLQDSNEEMKKRVSDAVRVALDITISDMHPDERAILLTTLRNNKDRLKSNSLGRKKIIEIMRLVMRNISLGVKYSHRQGRRILTISK